MTALGVMSVLAMIMAPVAIREHMIARRLSSLEFLELDQLIYRLKAVRTTELRQLAVSSRQQGLFLAGDRTNVLSRIGGSEGIQRMQNNALIILELAYRTQAWNPGQGIQIVKSMRRCAGRLERRIRLYNVAAQFGYRGVNMNGCLQELAAIYCYMVSELISLYRVTHLARTEQLVAACNWT